MRKKINSIITAKQLTCMGFLLIPISNMIVVLEWWIDKGGYPGKIRYESYPIGNFMMFIGILLIFVSPWLSTESFKKRFLTWIGICFLFILYMIPMILLFFRTGTPFQD